MASCLVTACALGEAYLAFQRYVRDLAGRGVILAVCSKNDEADAFEPLDKHPEMVLRRGDIASFVANWSDWAGNLRAITQQLNIGLDSLVFIDDSAFDAASCVRNCRWSPMIACCLRTQVAMGGGYGISTCRLLVSIFT